MNNTADDQVLSTPTDTPVLRDPHGRSRKKGDPEETPLEALASICTVIVIALFAFAFIGQNFEIPSGSMKNTLLVGDHLLVDRVTLAPPTKWAPFVHYRAVQRGDIIVFLKPNPETPDLILVKRVIGVPGDHIHLVNGVVFLNGAPQTEPHTLNDDPDEPRPAYIPYRDEFPAVTPTANDGLTEVWAQELATNVQNGDIVVPAGKVFAMGDNRHNSLDGRYWGFVPDENIMGRPMFVYWSFKTPADQEDKTSMGDRIAFMFHVAIHIFDGTRWSRTLHVIR
ncbi:MAG: signal peptidase I [Acidobacteriota bacterium]|nr:signal peptidase I [Acidobacteriota bacterium]